MWIRGVHSTKQVGCTSDFVSLRVLHSPIDSNTLSVHCKLQSDFNFALQRSTWHSAYWGTFISSHYALLLYTKLSFSFISYLHNGYCNYKQHFQAIFSIIILNLLRNFSEPALLFCYRFCGGKVISLFLISDEWTEQNSLASRLPAFSLFTRRNNSINLITMQKNVKKNQ
jgi:hypothetical protein